MKRFLALFAAVCMLLCCAAASAETYTATAQGMGTVTVSVELDGNEIKSVSVDAPNETPGIGDKAVQELPAAIVEAQSLAVDAVSGATVTSDAILAGVEECLKLAGLAPEAFKTAVVESTPEQTAEDCEEDIVVVGGGGAGMTAAIKAAEQGKNVILLEKMGMLGGNTAMGTTAYFAAESKTQKEQGSEVTVQDMYDWLMSQSTDEFPMDPDTTMTVAENSAAAADWMMEIGMDLGRVFNKFFLSPSDGSAPGAAIVKALTEKMDSMGLDYRLENAGTALVLDENGKISGVTVSSPAGEYTIHAKAVVLAAGGFAANPEMLGEYDARWASLGCSSSKGQNGDAIRMAMAIGADVVDMSNIKVNPTVYYNGDKLISMSTLRSNGGLLVSKLGKRFFSESGNYTKTSAALLEQPDQVAFMVFDNTMLNIGLMKTYNEAGYFVCADTIEALAEKMGIDPQGLADEVARNQEFCAKGVDEDFGRTNLTIKFDNPPFYAVEVHPAAQGTFGGLKVNTAAEVIDVNGNVIPGLYAAGETAGEGTQGNCPLVENTVFGTIAGEGAAAFVDQL